jgi:hypothetical protein
MGILGPFHVPAASHGAGLAHGRPKAETGLHSLAQPGELAALSFTLPSCRCAGCLHWSLMLVPPCGVKHPAMHLDLVPLLLLLFLFLSNAGVGSSSGDGVGTG